MTYLISQATFGETNIPASQALAPAGFDRVAFRPACDQVVPVGQANSTTAWTLPMPDGQVLSLLELPSTLDATSAHKELDSYGLCKIGGDIVPIIYTRQLPERSMATPLLAATESSAPPTGLAPTAEPQGGGMGGMVGGSIVLLALAAGVVAFTRRKPQPLGAGSAGPKQPTAAAKPKAPQRTDSRRSQLDDLLGGRK